MFDTGHFISSSVHQKCVSQDMCQITLSRSSGNSATGGRSHPLFILRTNQIGGSSLAGVESPRSAMLNVRFGEQSQVERAIRRDFAASPTQVATSAQCHTLDGTGK